MIGFHRQRSCAHTRPVAAIWATGTPDRAANKAMVLAPVN
jgi:hypothetical protein